MSDALYELLEPHFPAHSKDSHPSPSPSDPTTTRYLSRLSKLPLSALSTSEPQSLAAASHSTLIALQSLASRSSKPLISSAEHLRNLSATLPSIASFSAQISDGVSSLDSAAVAFSTKYSRGEDGTNELLEQRKRALLLSANVERVVDLLELPTLLSSAVQSAAVASAGGGATGNRGGASAVSTSTTYNAALDLHAHVRRLASVHTHSKIVRGISRDTSRAISELTSDLVQSLRGPNLKLASGVRTVGWLRRVAPELGVAAPQAGSLPRGGQQRQAVIMGAVEEEGVLGALFLVCRLANLVNTLGALEPLKELADQEKRTGLDDKKNSKTEVYGSGGHQTERYLKRFIELFREQSFGIISMFRSIFPADDDESGTQDLGIDFKKMGLSGKTNGPKPEPSPSALATFPLHLLTDILIPTLRQYLPNVHDRSARESLLTQVLYCAGSLGRLGGDFSILLADLYHDSEDEDRDGNSEDDEGLQEWLEVMKKHRIQAARLESLAASGTEEHESMKGRSKEGMAK